VCEKKLKQEWKIEKKVRSGQLLESENEDGVDV
jgi:hypothetical protein